MSPSLRRLMKEASELTTSPSPHFHAHPVSEENLYDWHFTLAGPPAPSPYARGIYHGRITLPPTYPLRPPSFRFLTPSGRFEVNREICLSISGHHEETWQPAWGIRTALIALRSFMEGDARGQVGGLDVGDEVRREYAGMSRGWCCEVCEGGRSNEVVLREWRGFCREKGVEVEDDDEEGEKKGDDVVEGDKTVEGDSEKASADVAGDTTATATTAADTSIAPTPPASAPAANTSTSTTSTAVPTTTPPTPTPTTNTTTPIPQTIPTPTPTTPAPAPAQPAHSQAYPAAQVSQDTPWLDKAIIGVVAVLIFMILRRVAGTD